ncbi:serine/threonine protein kinase, partial [Brevibacterium sp. SIMBA_078]
TFREDVLAARDGRPMSLEVDVEATQAYPMMAPPMTAPMAHANEAEPAPETGPVSAIMTNQEARPPQKRSRAWVRIGSSFGLLALAAV